MTDGTDGLHCADLSWRYRLWHVPPLSGSTCPGEARCTSSVMDSSCRWRSVSPRAYWFCWRWAACDEAWHHVSVLTAIKHGNTFSIQMHWKLCVQMWPDTWQHFLLPALLSNDLSYFYQLISDKHDFIKSFGWKYERKHTESGCCCFS